MVFLIHKDLEKFFNTPFYKHQQEAIELGCRGKEFIVTSGTGSGKSRTFMATVFNHILRHQDDCVNKTIAIIVYPMNALINSQSEELERYRKQYEDVTGKKCPFTFGKYTGQEDDDQRAKMQQTPPNIILTNYMMLELLMTRADKGEEQLRRCFLKNLHFLVLTNCILTAGCKAVMYLFDTSDLNLLQMAGYCVLELPLQWWQTRILPMSNAVKR